MYYHSFEYSLLSAPTNFVIRKFDISIFKPISSVIFLKSEESGPNRLEFVEGIHGYPRLTLAKKHFS